MSAKIEAGLLRERIDNELNSRLVAWFLKNHREMPWRRTGNAYHIWVSEIMLQQTQVDTVIPYYLRFVERFPTVHHLAAAELESVLKAWEGLGYYARARNLHRAAREIVSRGGEMPRTMETIKKIPGIGPYTAGAILSIAYGLPVPLIDGNVKRVLSRVFVEPGPPNDASAQRRLEGHARELMETATTGGHAEGLASCSPASLHNQGLMELGATVCTPTAPRCGECPLKDICLANRQGNPEDYPTRIPGKKTPHFHVVVGAIRDVEGRLLIGLRPPRGHLGGLWELPGGKLKEGEKLEDAMRREAHEELGIDIQVDRFLVKVNHTYYDRKVTLHAFLCTHRHGTPQNLACDELRWVTIHEMERFPFPAANTRILKALRAEMKATEEQPTAS